MEILRLMLLFLLVLTALGVALVRSLFSTVILFSVYSLLMVLVWLYLGAPDLAFTEIGVGLGITSFLFYLALGRTGEVD